MTTWRPIPGWEEFYEASDTGLIRSLDRITPAGRRQGRVLKPSPNRKGYLMVILARDGGRFAYAVHRLVAETFLGSLPEGWHTCHIDGDNQNNAVTNLKYATASENELDKVRHGRNWQANKTHCPQGHEYTADNTMFQRGKSGRKCRTCHRNRRAAARASARAA